MDKPIIILGAGPAGLSCAYNILKNSNRKVVIVDKNSFPGGAGGSFKWKGHTLDYGPHAFHQRGDEPEELIKSLFEEEPEVLIEGRKNVGIYLKNKFYKYPLQVSEAFSKFNPFLSIRILVEFFFTSIFHAIVSIPIENFENWGRKRFGYSLYKLSFGDYTQKVWKTKPNKISAKFASEKIQGFSFINLIMKLLRIGGQITEPYYQKWLYHKNGSGELYKKLALKIEEKGGKIILNTKVCGVETGNKKVTGVKIKNQENYISIIECSFLINTIPLPHFTIFLGNGDLPFSVAYSTKQLKYISLILVYVEFSVEKITDKHWVYLLENKFTFNRITEQKNLSPHTIEAGKTVLSFELTCRVGDKYWNKTNEELFELAKKDIAGLKFFKGKMEHISDYHIKRVPNVYEIYLKGFDKFADQSLEYIMSFKNAITIGRRGLFLQGDMHQAVGMGLHMGKVIADVDMQKEHLTSYYNTYVKYLN